MNIATNRRHIWLAVSLLLVFYLLHLWQIDAFPPFIDEALHLQFAERSWDEGLFKFANEGRLFTIWVFIPFQPHLSNAIWIGRIVTLLVALPGIAAMLRLSHNLAGIEGLLAAGAFYSLSTFHTFYFRLALADPVFASAIFLALLFAYRLQHRLKLSDAVWTGVLLFIAVEAKVIALVYLGVPLAAGLSFYRAGHDRRWRTLWAGIALAVGIGLTIFFTGIIRLAGNDQYALMTAYNAEATNISATASRFVEQAENTVSALAVYFHPVVFGLLLVSVGWLIMKRQFFLPLVLFAPTAALWLGGRQTLRWHTASATILLLCGAVVLGRLLQRGRHYQITASAAIVVYGMLIWLPFMTNLIRSPELLDLPASDYGEYVSSDASGFGIDNLVDRLAEENPNEVIGLLANCHSLRYMAANRFAVRCPLLNPFGENIDALTALIEQQRGTGNFVVLENNNYVPSQIPGEVILLEERPTALSTLTIIHLTD